MTAAYDFELRRLDGEPLPLREFRGQVLLVVNTASQCGFTPQLAGLQALHARYAAQGLVVLGVPCNQFGRQEPGSAEEIGAFCSSNYGVQLLMAGKVDVNGDQAAPLFRWLTREAPGVLGTRAIKWNFTKFLIGREGQTLGGYAPGTTPAALAPAIEAALAR